MLVGRGAVHGLSFFVEKIYKRKNRRKARICLTFHIVRMPLSGIRCVFIFIRK